MRSFAFVKVLVVEFKKKTLLQDGTWPWVIIVLTALIYAWSLSNGFIWDDHDYLVNNASMGSLKGLFEFWSVSHPFSALPLTISALWVEHALWGLNPWGYHGVNLVLHILNALLLFGLMRKWAPSLAGGVALVFAIHPIQVETVAWIAEQKNLWSFFYMMLAVYSFLAFSESRKKTHYFTMFILFLAALLSKSIAVCFVTIPVLYAWWRRGAVSRQDLYLTLPLLLVGAMSVLTPLYNESIGSGSDLSALGFPEKCILAGKNFFFYIKQILLPWRFLTFYAPWDPCVSCWWDWIFPVGAVALFCFFYWCRDRVGRGAFALLCFYGASIFPALGFLKVSLLSITHAADHFSYLSVPPVLILGFAAGRILYARLSSLTFQGSSTLWKTLAFAGVLFLSLSTFRLTLNYKNDVTLFGELQRESPGSFFANSRFGIVCFDNPDLCSTDRAIQALEKAVWIGPHESLTLSKLASAYERKGLLGQAKQAYWRASFGQDPYAQAQCFHEIGRVAVAQRRIEEAIFFLKKSLSFKVHPDYKKHSERYFRAQRTGNVDAEISAGHYLLGRAYFLAQDFVSAADAFRSAIQAVPGLSKNYEGLGASLLNQGDIEGALEAFREAWRLDPKNQDVRHNFEFAKKRLADKGIMT